MPEYTYHRKTDAEIEELGIQYLAGNIFTDRHCDSTDELLMMFMPLALMGNEQMVEFLTLTNPDPDDELPTGIIYEHIRKAFPTQANGKPIFPSMQILDPEDTVRFAVYVDEMRKHRG